MTTKRMSEEQRLENLTEAMVQDILETSDEEIIIEGIAEVAQDTFTDTYDGPGSYPSTFEAVARAIHARFLAPLRLTAARTPPTSDELAETLTRVRFSCGIDTSDRVQRAFVRLSAAKAEAERNATQAFQAGVAHQERANTAERERDEARAALAQARADALEEAVKIVAGFAVPTSIPTEGVLNFIIQRDFRIAEEIRALKPTPTQESETP